MGCALSIDEREFPCSVFQTTWSRELLQLQRSVDQANAIQAEEKTLSAEQGQERRRLILSFLSVAPRSTTKQIADEIGLTTSSTLIHLNKLEGIKLVRRVSARPVVWELL